MIRAQTPHGFELYVDPIYGEDASAAVFNSFDNDPAGPFPNRPRQAHPLPSVISGKLQHAPYSFRTVNAAVNWIQALATSPGLPPLPYTNPDNEEVIDRIVIHCLPGLYGPRDPATQIGSEDYDPRSGLPWNGEVFPIELPDRVSIQGTSALDTIFDARGYDDPSWGAQNLFRFAGPNNFGVTLWTLTFVDGVAMRGCRFDESVGSRSGAAVLIEGLALANPLITNCFVYGNDVGIAIFDPRDHIPRFVNNTIAWNQVGIYSSNAVPPTGVGNARPVVLNTILDPIRPVGTGLPPYLQGIGAGTAEPPSCFEGLDPTDVTGFGQCPGGQVTQNFNAYHSAYANPGNVWPFGETNPRSGAGPYLPIVPLDPWTGTWQSGSPNRGVLYVNDVLRDASLPCAPHDFRIAPMVRASASSTYQPSPFVNRGFVDSSGVFTMLNGTTLTLPPGIPDDDLAHFHAWDWDAEGFGNPRNAARRQGQTAHFPTYWCDRTIDLGADELGELIVTGYVDSTRVFSMPHGGYAPNTSAIAICDKAYFLNVSVPGVSYIAPQFNVRSDLGPFAPANSSGSPMWFAQLGWQNPFLVPGPDPNPPYAYTGGQHEDFALLSPTTRFQLTLVGSPFRWYRPFPRNRVCDIAPHLLDDIRIDLFFPTVRDVDYAEYDFLQASVTGFPPRRDIFQSNAWFDMGDPNSKPQVNDNRYLYVDPSDPERRLKSGHLSPPLTMLLDPLQTTYPSSFLFRNTTHPLGYWGAPSYVYAVGTNGLSAAMTVPYITGLDWYGYRLNFELYDPDNPAWASLGSPVDNVQTALVVLGLTVPPGGESPSGDRIAVETMQGESSRLGADRTLVEQARRRQR